MTALKSLIREPSSAVKQPKRALCFNPLPKHFSFSISQLVLSSRNLVANFARVVQCEETGPLPFLKTDMIMLSVQVMLRVSSIKIAARMPSQRKVALQTVARLAIGCQDPTW
jgi:hypothetical protein